MRAAERFFNLLKRAGIRRRKYKTREEARHAVFDYIEFFCNPQRKHIRNAVLSPFDFEQQQKLKLQVVYKSWFNSAYIIFQNSLDHLLSRTASIAT